MEGRDTHTLSYTHTGIKKALADLELKEPPSLINTITHKRACFVIRPNGFQTVA